MSKNKISDTSPLLLAAMKQLVEEKKKLAREKKKLVEEKKKNLDLEKEIKRLKSGFLKVIKAVCYESEQYLCTGCYTRVTDYRHIGWGVVSEEEYCGLCIEVYCPGCIVPFRESFELEEGTGLCVNCVEKNDIITLYNWEDYDITVTGRPKDGMILYKGYGTSDSEEQEETSKGKEEDDISKQEQEESEDDDSSDFSISSDDE